MPIKISSVVANLIRYGAFPVLMGTSVLLYFQFANRHVGYSVAISLGIMVSLSLMLHYLEKVLPYREDWMPADGQELNDFGHAIFGTLLGARVGRALVALIFPVLAFSLTDYLGHRLWPTDSNIVLQVVAVFLIADFGRYWEHRLLHRVPVLWKFHALHHSAEKLTILKTYRNHFIERCFQSLMSFGPLVLLGVPPTLILVYSVPNIFLGLFSHSNVDLRLGFLEYVINGPGAHRLHHSLDLKEGNTNYGSAIVIWDRLFGTYSCPVGHPGPAKLGIPDDPMPKGWWPQVLSPVLWARIERGDYRSQKTVPPRRESIHANS